MRGTMKVILTASLALALTGFALAQQRGPGLFGPGVLLMNPGVQKELKITDDQISKLKDALGKVREDHKDEIAKLRDASNEERQKAMRTVGEAMNKAIGGVLDAKQMKRFKEIQLQNQGAFAFARPDIQEKLKLTDDQKSKIREINEEAGKKMRELFQGGFNEETQKKMAELRKDTTAKVVAVLTDEQKKTWKEMTGAPFEVKFERPRRKD